MSRMGIRNSTDSRRHRARSDDERPRRADLPDHQLRLSRHGPRGGALRSPGARQHLHAHHEPDAGRVRGPRRLARRRRRGARGRERSGRRDDRALEPRRERWPHRLVGVALRRHLQPLPLHAAQARHRDHVRERSRRPRGVAQRHPTRTPRRSTPRPWAIPRGTSSTSRALPRWRTTTGSPSWSTTPWQRPSWPSRSATAPTSWCTRRRSSSGDTAPRSAA